VTVKVNSQLGSKITSISMMKLASKIARVLTTQKRKMMVSQHKRNLPPRVEHPQPKKM
jgi:aldehyde:ferredoxin oxidoreductase